MLDWDTWTGAAEPAATIVIELSPLLAAPQAQTPDTPPVPEQTQMENDPVIPKDVEETRVAGPDGFESRLETVEPAVPHEAETNPVEPPLQPGRTVAIDEPSEVELAPLPEGNGRSQVDEPRHAPVDAAREHRKPVRPDEHKPLKSAPDRAATKHQTAELREAATIRAPASSTPHNSNALPGWRSEIIGILERNKRYPAEAEARHERGTSSLSFSLNRQGRVTSARIAGSSGSPVLDAETLALVRRVQPFPPPPPDVGGSQISLVVAIRYGSR